MNEIPDDIDVLQSVLGQLQTTGTSFELDAASTSVLKETLEATIEFDPKNTTAKEMLGAMNGTEGVTQIPTEIATAFCKEIAETLHVAGPTIDTASDTYREIDVSNRDVETLLAVSKEQLAKGNQLTLSRLEINALVPIFDESSNQPDQEWMKDLSACMRAAIEATTIFDAITIDLPQDIADTLRNELRDY